MQKRRPSPVRGPIHPSGIALALFAAALAIPGAAQADDPREPRGFGDPSGRSAILEPSALPAMVEPVAVAADSVLGADQASLDESSYDVPGQIVVDARDDLDAGALAALAADFGLSFTPTALAPETRIEIAQVAPGSEAAVIARLLQDRRVEVAEPLARVRASFTANDPLLKDQWHMERIGAMRAWDFATGRGVTVAVVDTGIACETHGPYNKGTDLASTVCVEGWNFVSNNEHANDDQGHGTHVAGTIAQSTNNGIGATGVAFHARLMPVKVLSENGWGTTAAVADGIRWAADHGAHVINLSLGGPRNSKVLQSAIDHAISRGTVVVAAAGNTGGRVQYPGASDGVIGVSATDSDDKLAKFSSRGEGVDIAAPGVNVVQQTICNRGRDKCERYPGYSGTSMASPHVAGAAALLVGLGVSDPAAVERALRANARVVDDSDAGKRLYGAGILQAASAAVRVTEVHALVRLLAVLALTAWVARSARKKDARATSPWTASFLLPALAAGPGLFFFAPWLLPRVSLPIDLLARPIADLDLVIGASLHRWLPLANALIPFGLTALCLGVKRLRPVVAGFAVGTAAYLTSVVALGEAASPFGWTALVVWCAVNAAACIWIARTNLTESR
ncbi:MAG: peptidase S8 [Polyangiaceae bacterium]|nr:peptidase S8 [Polyangiaceae bacterium]